MTIRYLLALLGLNIGAFRAHPLRSLAAVAMMFGNNLVFYLVWAIYFRAFSSLGGWHNRETQAARRTAVAEAIPAGGTLRVDLTDVHYLDSAGLAVLFDHAARISVIASNEPAALANMTNAVAKQDGALSNLKIVNRQQDFLEVLVDVDVRDVNHLSKVIAGLRVVAGIKSVERAKG